MQINSINPVNTNYSHTFFFFFYNFGFLKDIYVSK